ncbi:MAG: electron transfer flavoprotein subunit beta/FixA family protein [Candidatus Lokiarchaeota archaeon]|nr:electron transfer flavoprotein subunit beta/FixA family protein [Candidatus Lokiarchaeota archaeon]
MLNIYVLIKQVPKSDNLQINRKTGALIRRNVENIINPDDIHGIELALTLKQKYTGTITAITMGPLQAETALREAIAMGVDNGLLITDPMFAYSDTLQTTLILKEVFEKIKDYDVIITGTETSDSSTGQVPYQLSEALEIPLITDIFSYEIEKDLFKCQRNFGHESQFIEVKLPIIIRISKHFNKTRHVPLSGIKRAFEKELEHIDFNYLNCPSKIDGCNKSPTQVIKTEKLIHKRKNEFINGSIKEKIQRILHIMKDHGVEKRWMNKK